MVGGLVQNQHIGCLPRHMGECEPGFLAARKRPNRFFGPVTPKIKAAEKIENLLIPGLGREPLYM